MPPSAASGYATVLADEITRLTAERDAAVTRSREIEAVTRQLCQLLLPPFRTLGCWCPEGRDIDRTGHSAGCVLALTLMCATKEDSE